MYPTWEGVFDQKRRLQPEWIKSHQTREAYIAEHGASDAWKWDINDQADKLCGKRSAEIDTESHAKRVAAIDKLAKEVNAFLHDRVRILLMAESTPATEVLSKAKVCKVKNEHRGIQKRPAADGGLNKKERMQVMMDTRAGGHDYEWSAAKVHATMRCRTCSMCVEQLAPLDQLGWLSEQTCTREPMEWPQTWGPTPGHVMCNLGAVWMCQKCHVKVWGRGRGRKGKGKGAKSHL